MKILSDTREQDELSFPPHPSLSEVKKATLSVGDYMGESESGIRYPLAFERKSLGDLFGTMGKGYKRFKKEILRAQDQSVQLFLMIECPMQDVWKGYKHSTIAGHTVIRKLHTLMVRYDVLPVYCSDRRMMARFILETLAAVEREWNT